MSPVRRDFRGTCSALSSPSSNDASKYHIDPEPQPHPLCPHHAPIFEMKGDKKKQVTPPHRLLSLLLIPLFLHQENRNQGGRLGGERDASIAIQSHSTLHVNPLHRQGLLSVQRWTAIKMMGYDRFIDVSLRFFDFIKVHGTPSLALVNSYL